MKSRLFWKILIGTWVMLIILPVGGWAFTVYNYHATRHQTLGYVQDHARVTASQLAVVLRYGGREGLDEFIRTFPPEWLRQQVRVRHATLEEQLGTPIRIDQAVNISDRLVPITATVVAPDGVWRMSYESTWQDPAFSLVETMSYMARRPATMLAVTVSLAFSALLAWYLTRPVQRLRLGFDRLAKGDLSVRLNARQWRRRDEITDLALDFDQVAAQLEQLVTSREQLLHDVSHELRTPLARLRLAIDLARQSSDAAAHASLDRIDAESNRIDELVGQLLTLARMDADTGAKDQYFDVPELVRAVVRDARLESDEAGITIETNIEGDNSEASAELEGSAVKGDAELLRRAIENVLRNAIRFSTRGRTVTITVTRSVVSGRGCYSIQIADQGPGIPSEALGRIFDPFVRVAGSQPTNGFGLGLAIARRAVMAHGGTIEARNQRKGGLEITLRIPFAKYA